MSKPQLADVALQKIRRVAAPPAPAGESPYYRPGRATKTHLTVFYAHAVKDKLRLMGITRGMTLQAQVNEALNDYFAKHGEPEIAE